jgi:hypothetical protein
MNASPIEHVFAGIPVTDYQRAVAWYELLFGRPPDVVVRDDNESMWQLAEKAWLYIVRDSERAGKSIAAILVTDLESHLSALAGRGIKGFEMETVPGLYRKAVLSDADGNMITIGQNLQAPE